jgi:CxxC motif-containing protein (DUF1111 family)
MKPQRALAVTLAFVVAVLSVAFSHTVAGVDAPTGFDNLTNGLVNQATHDADRSLFELVRTQAGGLGPTFNRTSCAECHTSPVSGGISSFADLLAGSDASGTFVSRLVHENAICSAAQDPPPSPQEITTRRLTLNTLGDGYVEAIANGTFSQIQASQPASMRGTIVLVPVGVGSTAVGRFGWKDGQVSLQILSAEQFLNEIGITSVLFPNELTATCDVVADPEDTTNDFDAFARFIRATKAPPRGFISADAMAGATLFNAIGCNVCHVTSLTTAPAGTVLQGGTYVVPAALGGLTIHPYSDFLLHDVGTGDGFGPSAISFKMRTAPLWGLRTHRVFLHDGSALTLRDAIQRHAGQATTVTQNFNALSTTQRNQVIAFLQSL